MMYSLAQSAASSGEMAPEARERLQAAYREAGMNSVSRYRLLDPKVAVPAFIKLLTEDDPSLRYRGAKLLCMMGQYAEAAIPHLRALVEDEDEHVGRAAKEALFNIEGWPGG